MRGVPGLGRGRGRRGRRAAGRRGHRLRRWGASAATVAPTAAGGELGVDGDAPRRWPVSTAAGGGARRSAVPLAGAGSRRGGNGSGWPGAPVLDPLVVGRAVAPPGRWSGPRSGDDSALRIGPPGPGHGKALAYPCLSHHVRHKGARCDDLASTVVPPVENTRSSPKEKDIWEKKGARRLQGVSRCGQSGRIGSGVHHLGRCARLKTDKHLKWRPGVPTILRFSSPGSFGAGSRCPPSRAWWRSAPSAPQPPATGFEHRRAQPPTRLRRPSVATPAVRRDQR